VLVVLNKIKEHPFDLNHRALQGKYPAVREFIRVIAKTGPASTTCVARSIARLMR
jgi:hypothetical protein